jgi:rubrerythrin
MPQFGSPFSELANSRKLTNKELVRAIRFMVAAEYEATQMYVQLAESTDNKLAVAELAPTEKALYAKGAGEVEEMMKKQRHKKK